MEDFCRLSKNAQNQSDNLQAESCKDWNLTGQAVKFFGLFTAAKQFRYFYAEKGTYFSLLSWNIQMYWLLLSLLANSVFVNPQFLYHMVIQKDIVDLYSK